jgi:hypothetical protein
MKLKIVNLKPTFLFKMVVYLVCLPVSICVAMLLLPLVGGKFGAAIFVCLAIIWFLEFEFSLTAELTLYLLTKKAGTSAEGIFFYDPSKTEKEPEKHLTL